MLIVLEGPDCAGKTTLADQLEAAIRKRYPATDEVLRLTSGPPERHPLDEYVVPLLGYRPMSGTHVICDRLHWGERVYPMVFNRPSQMDGSVFAYIEAFLASRGAVVAHLTPRLLELERRMHDRGDDLVQPDQLQLIRMLFYGVAESSVLPRLTLSATDPGEMLDDIIRRARLMELLYEPLNGFTTYVGPRYPSRLLLGDVRGPAFQTNDPIDRLRPAFMPYRSMSGAYLWNALTRQENDPMTGQIGVANACDVDDAHDLWRILREPPVVTLGKNAARMFMGAHEVPHPQWIRRFQHSRIDDYHAALTSREPISWN